jgi:NTE family protein
MVLGAGGISGIAWHLGVLEALRAHTGWDPATADVISGTSAGAVAATVTAAGLQPRSLLRFAEDPATLEDAIARATAGRTQAGNGPSWPGSLALGAGGLLATSPRHRLASLAGFLPRGHRSTDEIRGLVHDATVDGWPTTTELWLHACDYKTGERVTFGAPGAPHADLAEAVVASCAVPVYYEPVTIGGRRYVDGGLYSFANGDAMVAAECDTVFFLSPFATSARGPLLNTALYGAARGATLRQARREIRLLREAGARVVVIEPTDADVAAMGLNPMDRGRSRHVLETAVASMDDVLPRALRGLELPLPAALAAAA